MQSKYKYRKIHFVPKSKFIKITVYASMISIFVLCLLMMYSRCTGHAIIYVMRNKLLLRKLIFNLTKSF